MTLARLAVARFELRRPRRRSRLARRRSCCNDAVSCRSVGGNQCSSPFASVLTPTPSSHCRASRAPPLSLPACSTHHLARAVSRLCRRGADEASYRHRPPHMPRTLSPTARMPRSPHDDSGRRPSEALTGGSAQPSLPRMSLPGGRPYPRGRGGPARRLGGGHGDPNTTPGAARVLEARARVEAQRNRGSLA